MSTIQPYKWRHFCIYANHVYTEVSRLGGYIIIPTKLRIQGVDPRDSDVIFQQQFQGGFLCEHSNVTNPTLGTIQFSGNGWWYQPFPGVVGTDYFDYKLTLNGQDSNVATMAIIIK